MIAPLPVIFFELFCIYVSRILFLSFMVMPNWNITNSESYLVVIDILYVLQLLSTLCFQQEAAWWTLSNMKMFVFRMLKWYLNIEKYIRGKTIQILKNDEQNYNQAPGELDHLTILNSEILIVWFLFSQNASEMLLIDISKFFIIENILPFFLCLVHTIICNATWHSYWRRCCAKSVEWRLPINFAWSTNSVGIWRKPIMIVIYFVEKCAVLHIIQELGNEYGACVVCVYHIIKKYHRYCWKNESKCLLVNISYMNMKYLLLRKQYNTIRYEYLRQYISHRHCELY